MGGANPTGLKTLLKSWEWLPITEHHSILFAFFLALTEQQE
jgi:hypothetical protein